MLMMAFPPLNCTQSPVCEQVLIIKKAIIIIHFNRVKVCEPKTPTEPSFLRGEGGVFGSQTLNSFTMYTLIILDFFINRLVLLG
jgi:hypothetical protein